MHMQLNIVKPRHGAQTVVAKAASVRLAMHAESYESEATS